MKGVVEAQAPHRTGLSRGQWWEEQADVDHLVGDSVGAQHVAFDDASLASLGDVRGAPGEDGIAVVGQAILCYEADEALYRQLAQVINRDIGRSVIGSPKR